jgi:hypothetical protein
MSGNITNRTLSSQSSFVQHNYQKSNSSHYTKFRKNIYAIKGSCPVGYIAMLSVEIQRTFRRNMSPPSSSPLFATSFILLGLLTNSEDGTEIFLRNIGIRLKLKGRHRWEVRFTPLPRYLREKEPPAPFVCVRLVGPQSLSWRWVEGTSAGNRILIPR